MGKMFGFRFLENFRFPLQSQSIREFWRRWHISLSIWFRDYLYIPLGGNRVSEWRNHLNLVAVFFLCGLWHGASWTFVVWGLYHGFFLVVERTRFGVMAGKMPPAGAAWIRDIRGDDGLGAVPGQQLSRKRSIIFLALFGLGHAPARAAARPLLEQRIPLGAGVWHSFLRAVVGLDQSPCVRLGQATPAVFGLACKFSGAALEVVLVIGLLLISAIWLAGGTYNPFIYYRF